MKKIVYISGSRSDYYLMKRTLADLNKISDLSIVATCMHLSNQFGNTFREIEADGFKIRKVDMLLDNNSLGSMAKSLGIGLFGITQVLEDIHPDIVFLEGDRGESLAGAIAAAHLNITVIHHGGGDISGSIDDKIRSAISVLSDYHLTGNQESYKRLHGIGIPPDRIALVGEPGIDDIILGEFTERVQIENKFGIPSGKPMILLVYHPDTQENEDVDKQIQIIIDSIAELKIQTIAIYSNSDAGGRIINSILDEKARDNSFLKVFPNVERRDFLGLMNRCSVMLGNSSAGIIELPSFQKPFVCVGSRQKNRLQMGNIIGTNFTKIEIINSVLFAMQNQSFIKGLDNIKNLYGDGCASKKILKIVQEILEKGDGHCN